MADFCLALSAGLVGILLLLAGTVQLLATWHATRTGPGIARFGIAVISVTGSSTAATGLMILSEIPHWRLF